MGYFLLTDKISISNGKFAIVYDFTELNFSLTKSLKVSKALKERAVLMLHSCSMSLGKILSVIFASGLIYIVIPAW